MSNRNLQKRQERPQNELVGSYDLPLAKSCTKQPFVSADTLPATLAVEWQPERYRSSSSMLSLLFTGIHVLCTIAYR